MITAMDLGHVQAFIALATAMVSLTTALVPYLLKKCFFYKTFLHRIVGQRQRA